ncbi:PepSY domain-containing protein [Psychrobacillus vulpis]|uniref:PepSY domain-containing protein n=1 Tax=Psychrobacillus vulpis TaxID=2325572 RepID=A0A544TV58_9BACI|nr:PepSY domain-containing protein [Psychrobacillus vulpis]TQR21320.1 hypothetical protein FG384_03705 [Psychrobacillus vulpis]
MKFLNIKGFLPSIITITVLIGIGILINISQKNQPPITEHEVRSQLEQMYDAEVAGVTMKKDVYNAVITKSGAVYLVEMNAVTGDVNSLEQTDEFIIEKTSNMQEETIEFPLEETLAIMEQPVIKKDAKTDNVAKVEMVKPPTKIVITEKPKNDTTKSDVVETPKTTENTSPKGLKSAQSKVEVKPSEEKAEKPIKEVLKDAIKEVLKQEASKTEETKTDVPKEEVAKTEVAKVEVSKPETVKEESTKPDTSKTEETKIEEKQNPSQSLTAQTEEKKPDGEAKNEKPSTTVLITEEQAIKIAQQQQKGTVETSSFVKTNEGGYYLIVMKISMSESDSKESSKEKKGKATIQVHAISGKVLSVTWE